MSMTTPKEFLEGVIRPTLLAINRHSVPAEQLLLGTAVQESRIKYTKQLGGGPALGYFQMEPATHEDIWKNFLAYKKDLSAKVLAVGGLATGAGKSSLLETNHAYAAAMCRAHYARHSRALPVAGDVKGLAHYWKDFYNTKKGKGTVDEFIDNWKAYKLGQLFATGI
jgi:hypothetical protein